MAKKPFDVDKFVDALEMDEEIAEFDMSNNKKRDRKGAYRKCPRCGSRSWKRLYTDVRGKAKHCNDCKEIDQ